MPRHRRPSARGDDDEFSPGTRINYCRKIDLAATKTIVLIADRLMSRNKEDPIKRLTHKVVKQHMDPMKLGRIDRDAVAKAWGMVIVGTSSYLNAFSHLDPTGDQQFATLETSTDRADKNLYRLAKAHYSMCVSVAVVIRNVHLDTDTALLRDDSVYNELMHTMGPEYIRALGEHGPITLEVARPQAELNATLEAMVRVLLGDRALANQFVHEVHQSARAQAERIVHFELNPPRDPRDMLRTIAKVGAVGAVAASGMHYSGFEDPTGVVKWTQTPTTPALAGPGVGVSQWSFASGAGGNMGGVASRPSTSKNERFATWLVNKVTWDMDPEQKQWYVDSIAPVYDGTKFMQDLAVNTTSAVLRAVVDAIVAESEQSSWGWW